MNMYIHECICHTMLLSLKDSDPHVDPGQRVPRNPRGHGFDKNSPHKHAPNFQTVPFVTPCLSRDNELADFSSLRNKTVTLYPSFSRSLSTDAYVL